MRDMLSSIARYVIVAFWQKITSGVIWTQFIRFRQRYSRQKRIIFSLYTFAHLYVVIKRCILSYANRCGAVLERVYSLTDESGCIQKGKLLLLLQNICIHMHALLAGAGRLFWIFFMIGPIWLTATNTIDRTVPITYYGLTAIDPCVYFQAPWG